MSERIIATIAAFIIAVISAGGYAGIALLIGIQSARTPPPSEIIIPIARYLFHASLRLQTVALAMASGSLLAAVALLTLKVRDAQ
jgi:hypothetical protein